MWIDKKKRIFQARVDSYPLTDHQRVVLARFMLMVDQQKLSMPKIRFDVSGSWKSSLILTFEKDFMVKFTPGGNLFWSENNQDTWKGGLIEYGDPFHAQLLDLIKKYEKAGE